MQPVQSTHPHSTSFFTQLRNRNPLLFGFSLLNLLAAAICLVLIITTDQQVMGVNAWIKPLKFFVSIAILSATLGWLLYWLHNQAAVKKYSYVTVVSMLIETAIISMQAARGTQSHFNVTTVVDGALFSLMGIVITIFTLWTAWMGYLFFRQKSFATDLPITYIWGIRLGFAFFVVFAFEGGQMAANLAHTIGAPDGGSGLPLLNWSTRFGDLRVAHFFGMHSLQLLPLTGYFLAKNKATLFVYAAVWLAFVLFLYLQALSGKPILLL